MKQSTEYVVFFDGFCHLCNKSVQFILRIDSYKKFRFSSIQGKTARDMIGEQIIAANDSVIYLRKGKLLMRSDAALWLLYDAAWYFKWIIILLIIPGYFRNLIYDFIAKRRYHWFGRYENCAVPSKENLHLFLP
jgi:predicted DCC family thiol-disulfide oxidoreductase YuxK